ncbi:DUF2188 domain-containing protein [Legionella jordanis]|nr:DUF2188 domain-containing protein [Legionella jordanis]RMW99484.1 DUF2188 domain-containing protein [Legionella jordanis]RMX15334.1 DUF2188 domain-containing protein [Legionella jordanis]HAT8715231.1 DUF2188 domain-containing protein [Legionella jordanis]
MDANDYHVLPNNQDGGWDIKRERAPLAIRHFHRQREAVAAARKMSQIAGTDLFIHGKDGKIHLHDGDSFSKKESTSTADSSSKEY